jgi:hypothetical protein
MSGETANFTKYIDTITKYNELKLDIEQKISAIKRKEALNTATAEDETFRKALEDQLAQLQQNPPSPIAATDKSTSSSNNKSSSAARVNNISQQDAALAYLNKLPAPAQNNVGQIRFTPIDPSNLLDYINATQHLNPWGRERQCDKDLKDLLLHVNADMRNQLGKIVDLKNKLSNATSD